MKDVKEFATYVAGRIEEMTGCNAQVHEVTKNNGNRLTAVTIRENGCNIAPTIYVNDGFERYQDGTPVDELIDSYLRTYENSKPSSDFSVDFFTDFEQAKERLTMKLVNAEKNASLLAEVPHCLLGDLAILFQVQVEATEFGNAVITVRNEHLKMWNVSTASLFDYSKHNMEVKQSFYIQSLSEVMKEMMGEDFPDELVETSEPQMYVFSNSSKINGATGLVFMDKINGFAELHNCNVFILPSSIHELLIIPDNGEIDVDSLSQMVREVNTTLDPEDVLSDHVYFYDMFAGVLMIADSQEVVGVLAA